MKKPIDKIYMRLKPNLSEVIEDYLDCNSVEYDSVNDFVKTAILEKLKRDGYIKDFKLNNKDKFIIRN